LTRRIEPVSRQSSNVAFPSAIAIHGRGAGDSIDFHARYGRALHAQAASESLEMLLTWFRSLRHRRTRRAPWQVVWPAPEPTHSARP
jgi:hypothetical protein